MHSKRPLKGAGKPGGGGGGGTDEGGNGSIGRSSLYHELFSHKFYVPQKHKKRILIKSEILRPGNSSSNIP